MAVDRKRRDVAAQALADFMRGKFNYSQLGTTFRELEAVPPESRVPDKFLEALLQEGPLISWKHDGKDDRRDFIDKDQWPFLLRTLAFLKSDLPNELEKDPVFDVVDRPRQILQARWHALAMLLLLAPSCLISWWIGVVAGAISFIVYQICMHRRERAFRISTKVDERYEYYPFTSLKDWKDHEALLEPFHVPPYESSPFQPAGRSSFKRLLHSTAFGWTMAVGGLAVAFMYVCSIVFWPIWAIAMSLSSRKATQC